MMRFAARPSLLQSLHRFNFHPALQRSFSHQTSASRSPFKTVFAASDATSAFCRKCGGSMQEVVPEGDSRPRSICRTCSYVDYRNPRMVVGAIIEHEGKVLLCRRGIEPQRGFWTVPAGFLELGESTIQGAKRETMEEAGAAIDVHAPYVHFDIVGIGQAYLLFRSTLQAPFTFEAQAPESLEAKLFKPEEIPFNELAFSSVSIALKSYVEDLQSGNFRFFHGTIVKKQGAGPNDAGTFHLEDNIEMVASKS